jgi:hypothetical protein
VAADGVPPDGQSPDQLAPRLVALLGQTDAAVRDGIAYTLLNRWLRTQPTISDAAARLLVPRLVANLQNGVGGAAESDGVFLRSFSALVLSDIALRDAASPFLSEAERADLLASALAYAGAETDLRGHTGVKGWAHAAAHIGDLLAALARNANIDQAGCKRILDAVAKLALRRHGYILHHGEDSRLARPVVEVLSRGAIDEAGFEAWARDLMAPLLERGGEAFDLGLYATQRNARNLIVSVFLVVELSPEPPPGIVMARAVIRRIIG